MPMAGDTMWPEPDACAHPAWSILIMRNSNRWKRLCRLGAFVPVSFLLLFRRKRISPPLLISKATEHPFPYRTRMLSFLGEHVGKMSSAGKAVENVPLLYGDGGFLGGFV